jgi:hypothetical protein
MNSLQPSVQVRRLGWLGVRILRGAQMQMTRLIANENGPDLPSIAVSDAATQLHQT